MTSKIAFALVWSLISGAVGGQDSLKQQATSQVVIRVFSSFGVPLQHAKITLIDHAGGSREFKFTEPMGSIQIPYGDYQLVVVVEGFETYRTPIQIDRPKCWFTVGLQVGALARPSRGPTVTGSLVPRLRSGRGGWVKLLALYSGFSREAPVDETGSFNLGTVPPGRYVLVTQGDRGVLDTRVVEIRNFSEHIRLE